MIDLRAAVYALLNDGSINAVIDKARVEPIQGGSLVNVGLVHKNFNRIGQTLFNVDAQLVLCVMVESPIGYAEKLDLLVDSIVTKILTDSSQLLNLSVDSARVDYRYSEAGDSNLAEAEIKLNFEYTDTISAVFDKTINSLHVDIDKDANGSIEYSFITTLNN